MKATTGVFLSSFRRHMVPQVRIPLKIFMVVRLSNVDHVVTGYLFTGFQVNQRDNSGHPAKCRVLNVVPSTIGLKGMVDLVSKWCAVVIQALVLGQYVQEFRSGDPGSRPVQVDLISGVLNWRLLPRRYPDPIVKGHGGPGLGRDFEKKAFAGIGAERGRPYPHIPGLKRVRQFGWDTQGIPSRRSITVGRERPFNITTWFRTLRKSFVLMTTFLCSHLQCILFP